MKYIEMQLELAAQQLQLLTDFIHQHDTVIDDRTFFISSLERPHVLFKNKAAVLEHFGTNGWCRNDNDWEKTVDDVVVVLQNAERDRPLVVSF